MMQVNDYDPTASGSLSLKKVEQALLMRVDAFEFPRLLLEAMGIRQCEIVKKYGFRKAEVSECLRGMNRHRKIRVAVAAELGVSVEDIWPRD